MNFPRLVIAAPSSGSGKTTVVCGLLQALRNRGMDIRSFKCGPDYVDPLFHSQILGTPCRNLDPFFTGQETTRFLFCKNAAGAELSMIEGVMGYYDGLGGASLDASTYDLAEQLAAPVVLVVSCKGISTSLAAVIQGFLHYVQPSRICGVILNRISPMLYPKLKEKIEAELPVTVYGYLPDRPGLTLHSRHLGLVPAGEVVGLQELLHGLARQMEESVDINGLIRLAQSASPLPLSALELPSVDPSCRPCVAVANDAAFCFHYADNLDLLRDLGAEIRFFRPLEDESLPPCDGLWLGGGYPEEYAFSLAKNHRMRETVQKALKKGLPCLAEGGGFLYLHRTLRDKQGIEHPMAGYFEETCFPTDHLQRFGYLSLTAAQDNLLCPAGDTIRAHEFHYWESGDPGHAFSARKPTRPSVWPCSHASKSLYAGFPHLYFYANPSFASRFYEACCAGKQSHST